MFEAGGEPISARKGRYEVGAVLATGGMGIIHRAYDRLAKREVAYKRLRVVHEQHRVRMTALFQREYDTLARLAHPNIVSAYEYGSDELGPYYVMELLTGEDLSKRAPLAPRETCRVLRAIASALALVHSRRLLHRDISPGNVRMTAQGVAKLIDFGALAPFGMPKEIVGTPAFVAPECLLSESLDPRADLYSLGAIGYWLLTRKLAVRAFSLEELPRALDLPIAAPSTLAKNTPRALDELLLALLARDRDARPESAGAVIDRLMAIADLEPELEESKVAFSYLAHPPLQGRDEALERIEQQLDALSSGIGGVLVFEGAQGSGRSAMLQQLAIRAQLRGASVLRAEGKVSDAALSAVRHLVETGVLMVQAHDGSERRAPSRFSLHKGVDEVARSSLEAAERFASVSASLRESLLALAKQAPLVLSLDDADLADRHSVALLASLLDSVGERPILVAITRHKGAASDDAEARILAASAPVELAAFEERHVIALADTVFGPVPNAHRLARWLAAESGGNSALCLELVATLLRRGSIRYRRGMFMLPENPQNELPSEIASTLVRERVAGLEPHAHQVARVLSLHRGALPIDQLAEVSGLEPADVVAALTALSERNLLVESAGKYTVASEALRRALTPDEDAHPIHAGLARVLVAEGSSATDRFAAGLHLIRAGGEQRRRGADLIHQTTLANVYGLSLLGSVVPALEAALEVYECEGVPDEDCTVLLTALSLAGFFGDLRTQRRYVDRTLRVLSKLGGFDLAARLQPRFGRRFGLALGIAGTGIARSLSARERSRRPLAKCIEAILGVAASSTAALASAGDIAEATRIARWLDPLEGTREDGAMQLLRQFTVAVIDSVEGDVKRARERFLRVLEACERPLRGMGDDVRSQLRLGCLHGIGQVCLKTAPEEALLYADALSDASAFYAPHAESIRMGYHAYRGELERANEHRRRAESLALLGGASWSAMALMTFRSLHASILTDDVIGLLRAVEELERLAALTPTVEVLRSFAAATVQVLRGHPREALPVLESCLGSGPLQFNGVYRAGYLAVYARALFEAGEYRSCRDVCQRELTKYTGGERAGDVDYYGLAQQLALADAALGDRERAIRTLDGLLALASASASANPLCLGRLHRDRALLAVATRDLTAFDLHFAEMRRHFQATRNPWLRQQCEPLLMRAVKAGLKPKISPHELVENAENSASAALEELETELGQTREAL